MRTIDLAFGRQPWMSRVAILVSLPAMLVLALLAATPSSAQQASEAPPETSAETSAGTSAQMSAEAPCMASGPARQLDFWVGTWDVYNPEGRKAGVNVIERRLNGCLLLESWTGAGGSSGKSMNYWDPQRRTWRQVWISDRGSVLDYRHGEYRDGAMRFRGITIGESGDTTHQKLTFEDVAPDTVRQLFEASTDGGVTWDTTWVGIYVRRSGAGGSGGGTQDTSTGGAPGGGGIGG